MVTKVEAARIATGAGIPVVLTAADQRRRRRSPASRSAPSSTRPAGAGRPGCSGWPTPPSPRAGCVLDAGAVRAVDRAPRLAAGRRASPASTGTFAAGDPVDLVDPDGAAGRPRAWSTSTPTSCPALLGRSTRDLGASSGAAYEREVVHRDDLVLL